MARAATLPRGISLHGDRYRVRLTADGEIHSLGVYDTLTDAKAALAIAKAEKVRGTFVPPARVRAERRAEAERIERESVTLDRWAEQWLGHLRPGLVRFLGGEVALHVVVVDRRSGRLTRTAPALADGGRPQLLLGAQSPDASFADGVASALELIGQEPVAELGVVLVSVDQRIGEVGVF